MILYLQKKPLNFKSFSGQKLESMISAFAGDFSCMEGVSLVEYNGRNSCLKYAKAVIFLLKFVTETSFDFSGICDIIYHAEENTQSRQNGSEQMAKGNGTKLIAQNKKAYHDYFIEDVYQAGISLVGTEVKSLRAGKCSLKESFIRIENGQAFIMNMHISPYEQGNIFNKDPLRTRRLLLHKNEIRKIAAQVQAAGYTVVPLKVYFDRSLVKVDIALAKGKKLYDKRETIAKNDMRRQAEKEFKIRNLTL